MNLKMICIIATLLLPNTLLAQLQLTKEQQEDKMVASKIWKPFTLTQSYSVFQKGHFSFSKHQKPIFLYIGQRTCIVCSYEFPTYVALATKFPNIDFVYLTPDDTADIVKKFGRNLKIKNLFVIPISMNLLWDKDVAKVFPVKYFINRSGIVVDATTGGTLKDRPALKQKWENKLKELNSE